MKRRSLLNSRSATSGFTMIELIVVIVIIGVLFAIAAPNWVAFLNQQRVNSARSQLVQAIQTAQSEAKRTKINRAVVFQNNSNQPQYAIVPAGNINKVDSSNASWQNLGDGTIRLSIDQATNLIFDSYGAVVPVIQLPYNITINSRSSVNLKRCVTVTSLLGALTEGSNSECK